MTAQEAQETFNHRMVIWTLRVLTVTVFALSLLAVYTFAKVGGIEQTNRKAICDLRRVLEENEHAPDFDTMDRARLALARADRSTCPGTLKKEGQS